MLYANEQKIRDLGHFLVNMTNGGREVSCRILNGILQYAPNGILAIGASSVGEQGLNTLLSLGRVTIVVYLAIAAQGILVCLVFLRLLNVRVLTFMKQAREALVTAFMTTSSLGPLPSTMKSATEAGINDVVASFSLPLGATVNMDGAAIRLGA